MAAATKDKFIKVFKVCIIAILFLLPFGQLTSIPLPIQDVHLYLEDLLLVPIWLALIFYYLNRKDKPTDIPLFKPISLFIIACFLSLVFNISRVSLDQLFVSSLYLVRWIAYIGLFIASYLVSQKFNIYSKKIHFSLIVSIFATAIFGLLQYFLYPNLRNLYYLGWDPHFLRVFGTFFDPGFLGLIFTIGLILIYFKLDTKLNPLYAIAAFFIYIALALTYSRSSYISYLVALIFLTILTRRWRLFLVLLLLGLFTLFLLPRSNLSEGVKLERTSTAVTRINSWSNSLSLFKKSPIFGLGFDTLRYTRGDVRSQSFEGGEIASHSAAGIENSFLFILATTGIAGFLCYIYLLFSMFKLGNNIVRVTLLSISVHSFFNNSLFYLWIMIILWLMMGQFMRKSDSS